MKLLMKAALLSTIFCATGCANNYDAGCYMLKRPTYTVADIAVISDDLAYYITEQIRIGEEFCGW